MIIFVLAILANGFIVPVKQEEALNIDITKSNPSIESTDTISEKYYDKVYEIDEEGQKLLHQSFKNVITYVYDNDSQETQLLYQLLEQLNPKENKVDIIIVKLQSNNASLVPGVHLTHYSQQHYFDKINIDLLKDIINPKIKFLESQTELDQYLQNNSLKALLLINEDYIHYQTVLKSIEDLIKDGIFLEARIQDIKAFKGDIGDIKAPAFLLHDDKFQVYKYNLTYTDQIIDFIYLESLPTVIELNEDNYARVFGGSVQTQLHLLTDGEDSDLLEAYGEIAKFNKEQELQYERILFCHSNFKNNQNLWEQFDFDDNTTLPKLVITETNFRKYQLQKFIYEGDSFSRDSIKQFLEEFRNKSLKPFYKSELKPDNSNKEIIKIVGSTFTEEVIRGKFNTLLLFWDSKNPDVSESHMKLLEDIIQFINKDNLKIAHFDLALNEHPKITVDEAPKLVFFLAADKKQPKEYLKSSNLNVQELSKWLKYYAGDKVLQVQQQQQDL